MEKIHFKYHPNLYNLDILEEGENICQCCGKEVNLYYNTMYCVEDIECLCLECIANGKAAEKFDGTFSDNCGDHIDDKEKSDELYNRTPGYISWQGEKWRACCNDFCAFQGDTSKDELEELGVLEEVIKEYNSSQDMQVDREGLEEGYSSIYLFKCLHCGKYKIQTDCD